eukprot:m.209615 g.209615  ORF g.209615 m.209615 type:complete len:842 (+) comp33045_c0_seq6:464-2989(+)
MDPFPSGHPFGGPSPENSATDEGTETKQDPSQVALVTLNYESLYFNNLELLYHRYVQPLSKWGLIKKVDLDTMFSQIHGLYTATKDHIDVLGSIAKYDSGDIARIEEIARIFVEDTLIPMYSTFVNSFADIQQTVERCKMNHERFGTFLHMQERTTHSTLSSLLRQPILRIPVYTEIVNKLLTLLPVEHALHASLTSVQEQWAELNARVESNQKEVQNGEKLAAIELSFPYDHLELGCGKSDDETDVKRRWTLGRRVAGRQGTGKTNEVLNEYSRVGNTEWQIVYQMQCSSTRWFLDEFEAWDGLEKDGHKRRIFLFNDAVLVAKPRSRGTYTLRRRFKFCESWVGENDDMDESFSIIIGSPFFRTSILSFQSDAQKQETASLFKRLISSAKDAEQETMGKLAIFPFLSQGYNAKPTAAIANAECVELEVSLKDTAHDVIGVLLKRLGIPILSPELGANAYTLFELTTHGLLQVSAWECPLVISKVGSRCHMHRSRCQFVFRRMIDPQLTVELLPDALKCLVTHSNERKAARNRHASESQVDLRNARKMTTAEQLDQLNREKKKGFWKITAGLTKKLGFGAGTKMPYAMPTSNKGPDGMLYCRPLDSLFADGVMVKPLRDMISRLYHDGPSAMGLFRKSANARVCRQVRERLDEGDDVDFADLPILAVGAILKEFLRSLPDSVMTLKLYDEMVATNSVPDTIKRVDDVGQVIAKLPEANRMLLGALMPVFVKIGEAGDVNGMTPSNVGICIGQSIMWPRTTEDILKNDVPPFIEFLIVQFEALFGREDQHTVFEPLEKSSEGDVDDNFGDGIVSPSPQEEHALDSRGMGSVSDPEILSTSH